MGNTFTMSAATGTVDALTTLARVRSYLKSGTEHNSFVNDLIDVASVKVVDICRQRILSGAQVWQFRGTGTLAKVCGYKPATITTLEYQTLIGGIWTACANGTYELQKVDGVNTLYYSTGYSNSVLYRATLTVGYSSAAIPEPVQQVVIEMASVMFKESWAQKEDGARLGLSSRATNKEAVGLTESQAFQDQMPKWKGMLRPYTRHV